MTNPTDQKYFTGKVCLLVCRVSIKDTFGIVHGKPPSSCLYIKGEIKKNPNYTREECVHIYEILGCCNKPLIQAF